MSDQIRHRARKPKVRTGCITCKARRVKCDEEKPRCARCTGSGRVCGGYVVTSKGAVETSVVLQGAPGLALSFNPPGNIDANDAELRYFEFFCSRTVAEISGYFPSTFWTNVVLQASHVEPAVFHAIIALGSVHEAYEQSCGESVVSDQRMPKGQFALEQSNKAIRYLCGRLSKSHEESREIVLIVCLLFICVETFQGNQHAAFVHLDSGLKILGSGADQQDLSGLEVRVKERVNRRFTDGDLVPVFARLDIQASTYFTKTPVHYAIVSKVIDSIASPAIPDVFTSLAAANESLHNQLHWMLHYEQDAKRRIQAAEANSNFKLPDSLACILLKAQKDQSEQLQKWLTSFNKFLVSSSNSMTTLELRASLLLKLHHITSKIMLASTLFQHETDFDAHVADFERITTLAATLNSQTYNKQHSSRIAGYSLEMGIIPPLYLTACRCRDPVIRRKALELLTSASPRREGIWDAESSAALARWHIEQEEEGLGDIFGAKDVPASTRVYVMDKMFASGQRQCLVRFRRGPRGQSHDAAVEVREDWICW